MKGDIATALVVCSPSPVPGVAMWRKALPVFEGLRPQQILLAFDADWRTNPHVAHALGQAALALVTAGYAVQVEAWDPALGKGIDDLLAAGHTPVRQSVSSGLWRWTPWPGAPMDRAAPHRHDRGGALMALRPLNPAVTESLTKGWDLVASEGGRSSKGLRASVTLFNGTAQACRTLAMGDVAEQQAVAAAFAGLVGLEVSVVIQALMQLAVAVEGILRQMEAQGQAEGQSQATRLVALAIDAGVELFHTPEGEAYATMEVDGHTETWPLKVQGLSALAGPPVLR